MSFVLIIEQEPPAGPWLSRALESGGFGVEVAQTVAAASEGLERREGELVCALVRLDGEAGLEALGALRDRFPSVPRILLADGDLALARRAVNDTQVFRLLSARPAAAVLAAAVREAAAWHKAEAQGVPFLGKGELEAVVQQRTALLSRAKREWEVTFDAITSPLVLIDRQGNVIRANLAAAKARGLDIRSVPGRPYAEVVYGLPSAPEGCPVAAVQAGAVEANEDLDAAGDTVLRIRATRAAQEEIIVCRCHDITDERRKVRVALHTEKMVALGQLAGGVAHEINNPVASILAFAALMKGDAGRTADDLEALDAIEQSAQRCRRIVDNMLRFSRRETARQDMDLSRCLRDAGSLFQLQAKQHPRVCFELELAEGLPIVHANAGQVEQVALNMLQNALHALPSRAGKVGVRTWQENGHIAFSVSDSGSGIAPEHLLRIFEPSFTTKAEGEGTGFGLAIADTIVREHGGRIEVQSAVGTGTTFKVYFPVQPGGNQT